MPKPNRSPLFFFARDYQRCYERQHGQRININEAIAACYDNWKALSEEEKQPYKNKYEEWRIQFRTNPVVNQHPIDQTKIQNAEVLQQRVIPSKELKIHYDRFSLERIFLANEYLPLDKSELLSMPIYIINFQIFCEVEEEDGGQFIPAEMCILRYTLIDGITMYRHKFIKPESPPLGYMSSCLEHAKETHQIPLKDFCEATDNYIQIYHELKSFLLNPINNTNRNPMMKNNDDRARRRHLRLTQPCVFFPSLEYERTSKLIDWLQEKAEGIQPTKDTRLVNLASIESLIMVLAELKKHHVSRDDIQKTFANATYSYMIEERCPYHFHLGIHHCSVARCHAGVKLISAYLNQLYVPESIAATTCTVKNDKPTETNKTIGFTDQSYSTASSSCYRNDQRTQNQDFQSNDEITKLQQKNFHRLISNAESSYSEPNAERAILNQRKQVLLKALQTIDKQIEELDLNRDA